MGRAASLPSLIFIITQPPKNVNVFSHDTLTETFRNDSWNVEVITLGLMFVIAQRFEAAVLFLAN